MSSKRWALVSSFCLGVVVSCATAEDQSPNSGDTGDEGGTPASSGGKSATAGTTTMMQAGKSAASGGVSGSASSTGGKAGTASGGATHAGGAGGAGNGGKGGAGGTGGASLGGKGGTASGGSGGKGGSAGTSGSASAGGGSGSTGVGCNVEAAGGAATDGGASAGGAPGSLSLFFDDFESGTAAKWTTTLGTWTIVDDESKAYDQAAQENKLQIAIANGSCFADQVIDARVKVTGFNGQSNSYAAALFGRVVSPTTHYLLALGSDKKLALRKRVNTSSTGATAIGSAVAFSVVEDTWYDVHFEIIGTSLKGCIGAVCATGTDSSIASGGVAVGTVNTSARFDDVKVTAP
jgi:hypothetical protein